MPSCLCHCADPVRRKMLAYLAALVVTPAIADEAVPIPLRPIKLPELSNAGAEGISSAEKMQVRFRLMAMFERNRLDELGLKTSVVADPILQSFTAEVLRRLAPDHGTINYVLADRQFGASAYLGAVVVTHMGLWEQCDSLSAFAAVLSHEWVHLHNDHIARMFSGVENTQWLSLLGMLAGVAAMSKNQQAGTALLYGSQALPMRQYLAFSRDMEEEADREGMENLARAGFEPQGMVRTMEILHQYRGLDPTNSDSLPFLQTHPLTEERLLAARRRVMALAGAVPLPMATAEPNRRNMAILNREFDWIRYAISTPAYRAQQLFALRQTYGNRPWFEGLIASFANADNSAMKTPKASMNTATLSAQWMQDASLTPLLLALFARVLPQEERSAYFLKISERYPDDELIGALGAQELWRNVPPLQQNATAQRLIHRYLDHRAWQTPIGIPNIWDELLIAWYQILGETLGEQYFTARTSLTHGYWEVAVQSAERAQKVLANDQSDGNPSRLVRSLPNLQGDLQDIKSIAKRLLASSREGF